MSVVLGARISVTSVTQVGSTITVNGSGFSTQTVINFFNNGTNLGGFDSSWAPKIPLTLIDSTRFTFTKPAGAVAGPAFVQAVNPPFTSFTASSGDGGAFTLM